MPETIISNQGAGSADEAFYPDYFARFYDLIYHQVRDDVDNDYYLKKAVGTKGRILEAGVGTGRLFTATLDNGADIYGIDISPTMTDILKSRLNDSQGSRITCQNIIDFKFDFSFDLIMAPFRVFMHLTEKSDQIRALNNVYEHLNPGGRFIFDVFVPDLQILISGLNNVIDFDGEFEPGNRLKRTVTTRPDLINQLINVTFRFDWNEGRSIFTKEWNTSLRYFFRFELEHLIERSEFDSYMIYGDFDENELTPGSKEFLISCMKC